jgi:hypothetical protein
MKHEIIERFSAPTPKFFRVLRTIGMVIASIGGALVAAPIALPVGLVTAGGYLAVAGGVMTAVSQVTREASKKDDTDAAS